ncbi:translation initiation factor IF-2, partial [Parabacteroides distasonis]
KKPQEQAPKPVAVQQHADKSQQPKEKKHGDKHKVEIVAKDDSNIYALKSETERSPKLNVLGKIDLDAINQSTRPKKKSKEERRKEREEKAQGERRRRQRVNGERVDIEAAAKQNGNNAGKKKNGKGGQDNNANKQRNNNNNQAAAQQGGGKKKKNKNKQPQKPVEVSEEDVARQVKETLARLTNKTTANKKGAKYRKEKREAAADRMNEERMEQAAESKVLK